MKTAVFIDFQGTLGGSGTDDITTFEFYPYSIEAIKLLNVNNILVIGITNQSNISKGILSMEDYLSKLTEIEKELSLHDAYFNQVYCCPHVREDNCTCKKPSPGMVYKAKNDHNIELSKSYVVGDMGMSDMVLANNIGAKGVLVLTGVGYGSLDEYRHTWKDVNANYIADNVLEAVKWIIDDINSL